MVDVPVRLPSEAAAEAATVVHVQEPPERHHRTHHPGQRHADQQPTRVHAQLPGHLDALQLVRHRVAAVCAVDSPEHAEHHQVVGAQAPRSDEAREHLVGADVVQLVDGRTEFGT